MRLFISEYSIDGNMLTIHEERVVKHCFVLRLKVGDMFSIQSPYIPGNNTKKLRYTIMISVLHKKYVCGEILSHEQGVSDGNTVSMCVALPNVISKLHLIVQKLTEVGVDEIIFWRAHRSQMKNISTKKMEKLSLVAVESSEQSQRWTVPLVLFVDDLDDVCLSNEVVVFDKDDSRVICQDETRKCSTGILGSKMGIVGPEGGLSQFDYAKIGTKYTIKNLGETILRMETAAIVGGRMLVNGF